MHVKHTGLKVSYPLFYWMCIATMVASLLVSLSSAQANAPDDEDISSTIISRDVMVEQGDTLRSIASEQLGRAGYAPMLAEFNALVESAPLVPGNIIRIPIHVPARGEFAEAVYVKGNVTVVRNTSGSSSATASVIPVASDAGVPLQRNEQIMSGDTIITGSNSYVSISFSTGTVINLQPGTTATLQRLNCLPDDDSCLIEINTQDGKITSDVESRGSQPVEFRINTPYASAAVRGTVFDVDASEDLKVGVTEGAVELYAERASTALDTGFGSIARPGQSPTGPIALLPAPVFKHIPARLAPGDTVAWWSFAAAQGYGALLSTDEAAIEALESFEIEENTIGFDSIASGDYYLTVRALDADGLQGFKSNTKITIAEIDPDLEPVTTVISQQGQEFLVSVENGPEIARGYEIQVASDSSFSEPLMTADVDEKGSAFFRVNQDQVFARARIILDPYTVSAFGQSSSAQRQ